MATTKHGLPNGHEIGHGVFAIADELRVFVRHHPTKVGMDDNLLQITCYEGLSLISAFEGSQDRPVTRTQASAWFNFTPRANRLWARKPSCEMTSLSSYVDVVI